MHSVPEPPSSPAPAARILLAEDDEEMRAVLRLALSRRGYHVRECANGIELLEMLSSLILEQSSIECDLIISDIRMPGVTGLSVLEGLHSRSGAHPPMVLITAFGDAQTHAQARRYGAAAVIDKPFDIDHLCDVVHRILQPTTDFSEAYDDKP